MTSSWLRAELFYKLQIKNRHRPQQRGKREGANRGNMMARPCKTEQMDGNHLEEAEPGGMRERA